MLATTIAQRHARGHKGDTADDEHLARKSGVITGLGERGRRSLFLGNGAFAAVCVTWGLACGSALG